MTSSPRLKARMAGLLYLGCIVGGLSAVSIRSSLIVKGDAAATAANILASEPLYRASIGADLAGFACYVGVTALLYGLLKPVSPTVSRLAAFFSLAGCAICAAVTLNLIAPLILLKGAPYLEAFRPEQLQTLAFWSLKMHGQGYNIGLVNFGVYCTLLGYLVFRSGFLPRAIGALLFLAGASWLVDSLATVVYPPLAAALSSFTGAGALIGEASLCLWLLAFGVDAPKWRDRARAADALPA
jgi:hypothetical protein